MSYDAAVSRNETMSCPSGFERHHPQRLAALHSYAVLDTPPDPVFDDIARIAAASCGTALARITFVDADRLWTAAAIGGDGPERSLDAELCIRTLCQPGTLVLQDGTGVPASPSTPASRSSPPMAGRSARSASSIPSRAA